MDSWQERLVEEAKDLQLKIFKLNSFISTNSTDTLNKDDILLLEKQLKVMYEYYFLLNLRISRFENEKSSIN